MKIIENQNMPSSPLDKSDAHRMWAAISFAVTLIVFGIPLWWKTTEVYRATLPYDEIDKLNPLSVNIGMTINVYVEDTTRRNQIMNSLEFLLSDLRAFTIKIKQLNVELQNVTFELIEDNMSLQPQPGDLLLVEVAKLPVDVNALISVNRIVYFKKDTRTDLLSTVIRGMLQDGILNSKIVSIVSPETLGNNSKDSSRLRASMNYDVVFTIINSDPEHLKLTWNFKEDIEKYIQPLFEQISDISKHHIKSQWLYLIDLGEKPFKDGSEWLLNYSQLPHIITPLEKKLGSGISKDPSVHIILYIANCRMAPLYLVSDRGERLTAMMSPQWGAVQILNPNTDNCNRNIAIVPDVKSIMAVFTVQFQNLLRARNEIIIENVQVNKMKGPLLRSWELDSLYRMRTVEQITTATLTLQSLSKLLGEINNIVINEDVASAINEAVTYVNKAKTLLKEDRLKEALEYSRIAFSASEKAFSDPSLLALLYFPDDQKYAVYIPLFLPIMIPVLMSLKKIHCWLFSKKSSLHVKQD